MECDMKVNSYEELFKLNDSAKIEFVDNCIYIDDYYENIDDIYDYTFNRPLYPLWKYDPERVTRNGIDYNDCRFLDNIPFWTRTMEMDVERMQNICRQHWWKGEYNYDKVFEVNCFQTKTVFDNKLQHYPHVDGGFEDPDDCTTLNMIVYLDKKEDGGTAVYDGCWIDNVEQFNLLYPTIEEYELSKVIEHKYNRCVIFPGNRLHGAYINDYNNYCGESWRYAQVRFFHPVVDR